MVKAPTQAPDTSPTGRDEPEYRLSDHFWPYVDVPEGPSDEELALLEPRLREILLGDTSTRPFSVTVVFPLFDGPDYSRAVELAKASAEYHVTGSGSTKRHRARFLPSDALRLRSLFELVESFDTCEVLIDDLAVPYARELWLPLIWFLIRR